MNMFGNFYDHILLLIITSGNFPFLVSIKPLKPDQKDNIEGPKDPQSVLNCRTLYPNASILGLNLGELQRHTESCFFTLSYLFILNESERDMRGNKLSRM